MKGIPAMNKRGGKEFAQSSSRTGNTTGVPKSLSNRTKSEFPGAAPSRTGTSGGVSSAFYEGRGGKEYKTKVGR